MHSFHAVEIEVVISRITTNDMKICFMNKILLLPLAYSENNIVLLLTN